MRRTASLFSFSSALTGLLIWLRPRMAGEWLLIWPARLFAVAIAPLSALQGLLGMLLALRSRNPLVALAGLIGSALSLRYIVQTQAAAADFDQAFGADWKTRMPTRLQPRLLQTRWPRPLLARYPANWQRDVVYGVSPATGRLLWADLWEPVAETERTRAGIIYAHGGAWRIGDKDLGTRPFFRRLVHQGHVVLDIAYTLHPHGQVRDMVKEVKQAILWMKDNAARLGIDPTRIVLMGGSAGAHLALLAAYTPNLPEFQPDGAPEDTSVAGVVSFYAPTDFGPLYEDIRAAYADLQGGRRPWLRAPVELLLRGSMLVQPGETLPEAAAFVSDLLGGAPDVHPELRRLFSPIGHVGPHCPPTLLLQGTDDFFGLTEAARDLYQRLRQAGVPAILVEYPHTDHAFDLVLPQVSPAAQAAFYDVERFLALLAGPRPDPQPAERPPLHAVARNGHQRRPSPSFSGDHGS